MLPLAVLAGGFATRLGELSRETPKSLIEINGRPFVDWQLELLIKSGYTNFIFCVSYKSVEIQEYLGDGSNRGIRIDYSLDGETQLGTGGAIRKALPMLGDMFGVIYGDSYLPIDYFAVEQHFINAQSEALMTVYENQDRLDASNVKFINGKLIDYEKGSRSKSMQHIDYGLTYFKREALAPWAHQSSFDLSIVCSQLAKMSKLTGFEVFQRFYEIGSVQGIRDFSQYLRKAHP